MKFHAAPEREALTAVGATTAGMQRRQLGRYALGALAAAGLTACGGGGGGDDALSLREAYDKMQKGMTKKQVKEVIGRPASETRNEGLTYEDGSETLLLSFDTEANRSDDDYFLLGATWYIVGKTGSRLTKSFYTS